MSLLVSIATALPDHSHQQSDIADFMGELFEEERDRLKLKTLYKKSGIQKRYSVLPDFQKTSTKTLFTEQNGSPFLEERMTIYRKKAPLLAEEAIKKALPESIGIQDITHLITVSCTGMYAPGLDIDLLRSMGFRGDIQRTSVNFMGCYAALHGLKMADAIARSTPDAIVAVVCVELCTLHFQQNQEDDNIIANLLFADGAAAAFVLSKKVAAEKELTGLEIIKFYSKVNLSGGKDMAWHLSSKGFLMTLSSYIPELIKEGLPDMVKNLLTHIEYELSEINHWAIHPGGRKILETIENVLQLNPDKLAISYETLRDYGNMSSPTILFVLKEIMERSSKNGEHTMGAAFGPGLTMETILLKDLRQTL